MAKGLGRFLDHYQQVSMASDRELYSQKILRVSAIISASSRPAEHYLKELWSKDLKKRLEESSPILVAWFVEIEKTTRLCLEKGTPLRELLVDCARFVRADEVRVRKALLLKRQFAFQGAVLAVAPWGVVYFNGWPEFNAPFLLGVSMQIVGLAIFVYFTKTLTKEDRGETIAVRKLLLLMWIRCSAGLQIIEALRESVAESFRDLPTDLQMNWHSWSEGFLCHGKQLFYQWPRNYELSAQSATALQSLIAEGAGLLPYLKSALECLEQQRQFEWEEKLSLAPSRMSLILCAFFAPAVFFLLVSTLWNQLQIMIE
jgi:hypothetical protein